MDSVSPTSNPLHRLQMRMAQARFFTFSLLIHLMLLVFGGSMVLIKLDTPEPKDFVGQAPSAEDDALKAPPVDPMLDPDTTPFQPPTPQLAANLDVIASTALVSATVQSAPLGKLDGNATGLARLALGQGDQLARMRTLLDVSGGTSFGDPEKTLNALTGTFYDLKQTRRKKPTEISNGEYQQVFRRFVSEHWRESILDDYFKGPQTLSATQIMIPSMSADEGPKAFGLEGSVQPSRWLVHYKGKVSPPVDGVYHFVGAGDDVMIVRFNGKVVLDRCWYSQKDSDWRPQGNYDYGWSNIPGGFAKGDAIQVRAGQFYDMDVLIGEQPGGMVFACLLIEQEGATYRKDKSGAPILPVFRLADVPVPKLARGQTLPPFEADGPVWKAVEANLRR